MTDKQPNICGQPCEVYSRVCGYIRPVQQWNPGKKAEYARRREYTHLKQEIIATERDEHINDAIDSRFEGTPGY
jgi:hypothetical protein